MTEDGAARVDRLTTWIKKFRRDLLDLQGDVSPSLLAEATARSRTYWSDVLRKAKPSFAAAAAREVEDKLKMPSLHLEGVGWPFEDVDQRRFDTLGPVQKGRIEQALIDALDRIEMERGVVSTHPAPIPVVDASIDALLSYAKRDPAKVAKAIRVFTSPTQSRTNPESTGTPDQPKTSIGKAKPKASDAGRRRF